MGACMSSGGGDTIEARTNRDLEKMIKEVRTVILCFSLDRLHRSR